MSLADVAVLEPKVVGDVTGAFYVPAYQRGFRWGKEEVERLLGDIWENKGRPYYLQPIVVKAMPDGRWELIDGQQRLTTLYLIFQFMRDQGLQSAGAGYTLEYETRPGSQDFLRAPNEEQRDVNIDFHHIYFAYKHIQEWFENHGHRKQWAANKLYNYLFESVKVIWYEVPLGLDSIALFTRLNVGRIPLTDAELVKALVLAKSRERAGFADKSEQIAAQWDAFERELRIPEVWSFITGKYEYEATHIELLLDTIADRSGGRPMGRHRPRYFTFETLRPEIEKDPQDFWDEVVGLHSLIIGWYEDRDVFHKVGYLVALGDSFPALVELASGQTQRGLHDSLDVRISERLILTREEVADLEYEANGRKCAEVLLLMNVETVRQRSDTSERYSFRSHARGAWSLEHIHAQNAKEMKRDEKIWAEWLILHREALNGIHDLELGFRAELTAEIDAVLAAIADAKTHGIGSTFDSIKVKVEAALSMSAWSADDSVHSIANLALLASGDNSALSNSTFEVKRRAILQRDKEGSYIPACTRNVFLKYYTESAAQQIHYWGVADRDAYLREILAAVNPYLLPAGVLA
ncbi:DUF262 domain-containing protein [Arthrobacter sp. CG_A4]|uniref:DUF262 domain-containing protein n=1 Tax=Arthrobacter sp. CG_A4 TaxID=3071706 RepID=UPI002E03D53F|nr:hypothetical protein [Arthrobacter sp. CG_A4]